MSGFHVPSPWEALRDLRQEVEQILGGGDAVRGWGPGAAFPPINLYDAGDRYVLTAELPGLTPEELDLSILGETLTLRGDRKRPAGIGEESYRRRERGFGRWARSVSLPERVDPDRVTAEFARGVLTVVVPKAEASRPRQIPLAPASS